MEAAARPRVLVVGDEEAECDVLIAALHQEGCRTEFVRGAAAACAALRRYDFDAVLADLPAPDVDAFAILRASRRRSPAPRAVFLLPATPLGPEPLLPSLSAEAFDCLRHPIDFAEVAGRLTEAADAARAETRAQETSHAVAADRRPAAGEGKSDRWGQFLTSLADPGIASDEIAHVAVHGLRSIAGAVDAWVFSGDDRRPVASLVHAGGGGDLAGAVAEGLAREVRAENRPLSIVVGSAEDGAAGCYDAFPLAAVDGTRALVLYFAPGDRLVPEDRPLVIATAAHLARRMGEPAEIGDADQAGEYVVHALTGALALHDAATEQHSRRVGAFASDLAVAVGLPAASAELRDVERAAVLHDIGKLGVRKDLLRKSAPLTVPETLEMREHPVQGFRILHEIPGLERVAAMIHASHEHWDGRGYPRRLAGEEIPLGARVVSVADAWDTMTYGRPYRRPIGAEDAADEIRGLAGAQFDPGVVRAFERVVERWSIQVEDDGQAWRESAA